MNKLVFNELSLQPVANNETESYVRILRFIETFKKAKVYDFNRIIFDEAFDRITLCNGYTLNDFCNKYRTVGTLLRGLARYPFIDDNSEEERRYIENNFFLQKNGDKLDTYGLAAAYLYSTIGIGYLSEEYWDKIEHILEIEGEEEQTTTVLCASRPEHFEEIVFEEWLNESTEVTLVVCDLVPAEKAITLRDDHGKDKLRAFANKMLKSPYVIGVINSLKFNPHERKFTRKMTATGTIELVLTKTDEGLGMVVKTTGRNLKETERIATILEAEYMK